MKLQIRFSPREGLVFLVWLGFVLAIILAWVVFIGYSGGDQRAARNLSENAVNERMAFYLYVLDHDALPHEFKQFVTKHDHLTDTPDAINEFFKHIRSVENPSAEELRKNDVAIWEWRKENEDDD